MANGGGLDYCYAGIGIDALLDGTPIEVVQAVLRFPLGGVAGATVKLAIGASGGGKRAQGYRAVQRARMTRSPIQIRGHFTGQEKPGKGWDNPNPTLFDGFVSSPKFDAVAKQTIGQTVDCEHILSEFDAGSKISHILHSESQFDLSRPVALSSNSKAMSSPGVLSATVTPPDGSALSDLWGGLIKPVFTQLATLGDRIAHRSLQGMGIGATNDRVLAVLPRVNQSDAMPATVKADSQITNAAKIADTLIMPESGQSMLETLFNFCYIWQMAVIPRFDSILVVPHLPTLNRVYKTITPDEYFVVSSQSDWPRMPIRGVALMAPLTSAWSSEKVKLPAIQGVADLSVMGGGNYSGQMLVLQTPSAFADVRASASIASKIQAEKSNSSFIGNPDNAMPLPAAEEIAELTSGGMIGDLAKAVLCYNRYKDRGLTISGRVRTDICPGSLVEMVIIGDVGTTSSLFGCVTQVEYLFNAETPSACTNITVSHLRTEAEQNDSPVVMGEHPLFTSSFVGARM
jgi:hypothetical protein